MYYECISISSIVFYQKWDRYVIGLVKRKIPLTSIINSLGVR